SLAVDLASSIRESCEAIESRRKPGKTRLEVKRFLELRVKKKVKEQFRDGKFHDLLSKVISDPTTLENAYDCLRVASNVDLSSEGDGLGFQSISEELALGNFDVEANIYSLSTRGRSMEKELLVFPNLRLRVVQEAIRIALEVVYRPHFHRISHSLRSGRGHCSALKYVLRGISNPDWWFTLLPRKKVDDPIFGNLVSTLEERIADPCLVDILRKMFDARALNLEFGGFPKGHGLPQEGLLSPILMNIYLDLFDRQISRLTMQYETSGHRNHDERSNSKLRSWFRRQIDGKRNAPHDSDVRIHCVRFMDEIFVAISGPEEVALRLKSDAETYLQSSLHLEIDDQEMVPCREAGGVKFLGTLIKRRRKKEIPSVIAVHKLRDKVKMFVDQKQEQWNRGAVRIGKKWLAHGLKKVKESEIEHLADPSSLLSQVSSFRKPGMRTDHWYKELLKIWMQGVDAKNAGKDEESILVKLVVEPSLPGELTDSFREFRRLAGEYISSETASTLSLLPGDEVENGAVSVTEILAPVKVISKRLHRYGVTYRGGYARPCDALILLDDDQIVDWFAGVAIRWLRWYRHCGNFGEVKLLISDQLRQSCIRTLASKYRIHEANVEARFDSELGRIPEDFDSDDGALTYGTNYSGACLVSVARVAECRCFVVGCRSSAPCVYAIRVMERQRFPAWKTGFPSCIHPSLNGRRIGLCKPHLKDLFLGRISLQSVEFGAW
ncbi:hypothetical protein M569_08411, partial [Genlisea aurea]